VDALQILNTLTPEQIEDRLDDLDREARALRVLLRSVKVRQGDKRPAAQEATPEREVCPGQ
jgi:hypothetical protein